MKVEPRSPFYKMLQTGDSLLRRRLNAATKDEFSWLPDLLAAGMTDYVAIISRFVAEGVIGEMDGVYTSWATRAPNGRPKSPRFSVSRHTSQQTA
jgi:adenylate cyclase